MGCTWGAWCLHLDGCKVGDAGVLELGVLAAAAAGDGWWQGVDEGARHCRSCSQGAGLDLLLLQLLLKGCALVVQRPAVLCTGLVTHASCVGGFASCSIASLVHLLLLVNDLQRRVLHTALGCCCWLGLLLGREQVVMLCLECCRELLLQRPEVPCDNITNSDSTRVLGTVCASGSANQFLTILTSSPNGRRNTPST